MSKTYTLQEVKTKLRTDRDWANRALEVFWFKQTASERDLQMTVERNGVGFNGVDAEILTSFAEQLANGKRYLSSRQYEIAFKKLPKYATQLLKLAEEKAARVAAADVQKDIDDLYDPVDNGPACASKKPSPEAKAVRIAMQGM